MKKSALAAVGLLLSATIFAQPGFSLKEYALRAPMEQCPAGTTESTPHRGILICMMGGTTLANQEVVRHSVYLYKGVIAGAMFTFPTKGRYANQAVKEALTLKFGRPFDDKPHINEAVWRQGRDHISFDGYAGTVGMMDQSLINEATRNAAQGAKSDL